MSTKTDIITAATSTNWVEPAKFVTEPFCLMVTLLQTRRGLPLERCSLDSLEPTEEERLWLLDAFTHCRPALRPDDSERQRALEALQLDHNASALLLRIADQDGFGDGGGQGRKLYAKLERLGLMPIELPVLTDLGVQVVRLIRPSDPEKLVAAKTYIFPRT